MRFRGRLRSPDDKGPGLPVAVFLDDHGLTVEADGERVGRWSLAEVTATRTSSDQFDMTFGHERYFFEAEDILSFSYEALPHIDGGRARGGVLTKIRSAFLPSPDEIASSSIDLREDRNLEVVAVQPSTEVAAEPADASAEHCRGIRKDGQPCRSSIIRASGFCSSHDPNRGSRTRQVPVENPSLASVFRHLERAVADVRAGRMDSDTAIALAGLAKAMCATIDADEALIEPSRSGLSQVRSAS